MIFLDTCTCIIKRYIQYLYFCSRIPIIPVHVGALKAVRTLSQAKSWEDYEKRHGKDLSGAGLTSAITVQQSLRRVAVVTEFLKAGIPLARIGSLRLLPEDGSERLPDSSYFGIIIVPFVLETENNDIMNEV